MSKSATLKRHSQSVFRKLSKIYDGIFLPKQLMALGVDYFYKKLNLYYTNKLCRMYLADH